MGIKSWLVLSNQTIFAEIQRVLHEDVELVNINSLDKSIIRHNAKSANGIIIYISDNCIDSNIDQIIYLKTNFSMIPIVGVCNLVELDSIRECGKLGIDKIFPYSNLSKLLPTLIELTNLKILEISLKEFGIDINIYSHLLQKALKIIEKHFISLVTVKEISSLVGVKQEVLSREFKKYNLTTPKKLLIQIKIKYATQLMHNHGLNLSEVAYASGFSDLKRFNECFHRIYNCSPSNYLDNLALKQYY